MIAPVDSAGRAAAPLDFAARATAAERMDADDIEAATYAAVLTDLARVNTVTRARPPTLAWLARAARDQPDFSLIDIGFGHGDMLRAIARRFPRARLTGVDLNPRSAPVAAAATDPRLGIRYLTGDAMALPDRPDFIVSSLVAHHMRDAELVAFMRWMDMTARSGWLINDLHRHPVAWAGYAALATLAGWHPIVRHDGALSVRRAFSRSDWRRLLTAAGVAADVRWHLPFRWTVGALR